MCCLYVDSSIITDFCSFITIVGNWLNNCDEQPQFCRFSPGFKSYSNDAGRLEAGHVQPLRSIMYCSPVVFIIFFLILLLQFLLNCVVSYHYMCESASMFSNGFL